jgi:hypothetical protein
VTRQGVHGERLRERWRIVPVPEAKDADALLAVLGVDLIVLVGFVTVVLTGKRRVVRQPGAFRGALFPATGGSTQERLHPARITETCCTSK